MKRIVMAVVAVIVLAVGYASANAATCCDKDWVTGSGTRCHWCP